MSLGRMLFFSLMYCGIAYTSVWAFDQIQRHPHLAVNDIRIALAQTLTPTHDTQLFYRWKDDHHHWRYSATPLVARATQQSPIPTAPTVDRADWWNDVLLGIHTLPQLSNLYANRQQQIDLAVTSALNERVRE